MHSVGFQLSGKASGLGLEAQCATIEAFIAGKGAIVAEFTEVESGKLASRPQT